jgi:transcription elongation GreA/GreB family factor
VEDLPERPISGHRNLVTSEGITAIDAALQRFQNGHRDAVGRGDAHAAAAALRAGRDGRAGRATAEVIKAPHEPDTVSFGTTVTLRRDHGREQTFRIVGEDEADPSKGSVSYVSPFARAVMTCRQGDTVEFAGGKAVILNIR